ncbi:MAG: hypothetical protein RLZZ322_1053, partial [Verrucomicrobiota bacterium]
MRGLLLWAAGAASAASAAAPLPGLPV